jgi:hypothetical protein
MGTADEALARENEIHDGGAAVERAERPSARTILTTGHAQSQ